MPAQQIKNLKYNLVSVEKAEPPEGSDEGRWYQYVIARGESTMVGNRRGTLKEVTHHAEVIVNDLNSRDGIKNTSVWSSQSKR